MPIAARYEGFDYSKCLEGHTAAEVLNLTDLVAQLGRPPPGGAREASTGGASLDVGTDKRRDDSSTHHAVRNALSAVGASIVGASGLTGT